MIYYLHPLLAGPIATWARHFEHCARLGFSEVLVGPPFLPGRGGDIFLTADHHRLHPQLGGGDALAALAETARTAREHGLGLMLDLVADRVAVQSTWVGNEGMYRALQAPDALPDPRVDPRNIDTARLQPDRAAEAVSALWQPLLAAWQEAGVGGFCCRAPHRVPSLMWRQLIAGARRRVPESRFIAWVPGVTSVETQALISCGFDMVTSSSWAWDFRAAWLKDETRRLTAIGRLLSMPELPFGRRLASSSATPEATCRRALGFAATYGQAWLLPMGFEFGARAPLHPIHGDPAVFESLRSQPRLDLCAAVTEANRQHRLLASTRGGDLISAPGAPIAAFLRASPDPSNTQGSRLVVVNTALDVSARHALTPLLPAVCGVLGPIPDATPESSVALAPGEVRIVFLESAAPILLPDDESHAVTVAATAALRIAIEAVTPVADQGRFAVRQTVGESVAVTADIFCDGHEVLGAALLWRPADETRWREIPLVALGNDSWTASFPLLRTGRHLFTVEAWIDPFASYRAGLLKKQAAGVPIDLEVREGLALVTQLVQNGRPPKLHKLARRLAAASEDQRLALLLAEETRHLITEAQGRPFRVRHTPVLSVDAERKAAHFAAWYEIFPRSQSATPGLHGTFDDVIARLPRVRDMGFDVLYFPPIHPIGQVNRKGRNNALRAEEGDPGSPYAIGSAAGGHDAIHPELGTVADFRRLCRAAAQHGLEIALDFAVQCAPDHPWLREHPEWFTWRPDGSIQHAENPPKKYEDIVNVAFYADGAVPSLWLALRDIVQFWIGEGIRIFRVDNPHTKPLPFWEWLIADIRGHNPDIIFLAEAFTRPKVMYRLAKIGFTQSYSYFTWRNSAAEMRDYLIELTTTSPRLFFQPHFFVNTPDINPVFLQESGRPGFLLRAALAATLSGLWGVYNGFELCEAEALDGREEYRDSEKYQLRQWDFDRPGNIIAEIRQLNHIRRTNPALHSHLGVRFLPCPNGNLLCYVKTTPGSDNVLLIAVSFDPRAVQEADIDLPSDLFGATGARAPVAVEDLMHGDIAVWSTGPQRIRLDPAVLPFAIWRMRPNTEG